MILVQGFGRFGPFGPRRPTRRYDLTSARIGERSSGCPLVCFGLCQSVRLGLAQLRAGKPPAALAFGRLGRRVRGRS